MVSLSLSARVIVGLCQCVACFSPLSVSASLSVCVSVVSVGLSLGDGVGWRRCGHSVCREARGLSC